LPRHRAYRRRASIESQLVRDTTRGAALLNSLACLLLGVTLFLLFYWILPSWLQGRLQQQYDNPYQPLLQGFFARRERLLELAGIASLIGCLVLAVWKHLTRRAMPSQGQQATDLLSRLLAKLLN